MACRHSNVSGVRIADEVGPFNAGYPPRPRRKSSDSAGFASPAGPERCVHNDLALGTGVVYSSAMPLRRIPRALLALLIAYAMVLGGVAPPVLGHGFEPSLQLCAPNADPAQEAPRSADGHVCCLALCGGQAAVLPPLATPALPVDFSRIVHAVHERDTFQKFSGAHHSARAPPRG